VATCTAFIGYSRPRRNMRIVDVTESESNSTHQQPADHFAEDKARRTCEHCGEQPAPVLMNCSSCKMVGHCGRDCQRKDWMQHKPHCVLASVGRRGDDPGYSFRSTPAERERLEAEVRARSKELKAHKKSGGRILTLSMTSFGMVGQGMPIPDGVPPNFGLKQAAVIELQTGFVSSSGAGRSNFKGERSYREYC
jgi:hypothetical protein